MIKVILVDDEKLALDYIEHIIDWADYGFQVVGAVTEAERALTLYRKYQPELIITDVKMPGISGMDLATTIRENDSSSHILFLSGYREFTYIKQALRLGIDDYLLKSDIDADNFLQKILIIKETIEKEKLQRKYTLGKILQDIFLKKTEEHQYKNLVDDSVYIKLHKRYHYVLLSEAKVMRFITQFLPGTDSVQGFSDYYLENLFNDICDEFKLKLASSFDVEEGLYLLILELNNNLVSQHETADLLYQFALKLYRSVNIDQNHKYNVFYYTEGCPVHRFSRIYQEYRHQISVQYVKSEMQIIEFGTSKSAALTENKTMSMTTQDFYSALEKQNKNSISEYLQNIHIALEEQDYITFSWYVRKCLEALDRFNNKLIGKKSGRAFLLAARSDTYDFRNPLLILEFIKTKADEITNLLVENQHTAYSKSTMSMILSIQNKYYLSDLSINEISDSAGLSPTWAAIKFKEEVGMGLNDYLNEYRIKRAMELFDKENLLIYEVAEKTGFTSSQYFSKVFKKYSGLTPNEYKNGNLGGKSE